MADQRTRLTVTRREAGLRLDQFLRQRAPRLTRGMLRRILAAEPREIRIDGRPADKGLRLAAGQTVELPANLLDPSPAPRNDLALDVIAVRELFVVVNKPAGIHTHPLTPGESDTLAGRLVARFPECLHASPRIHEAGLVHRLDRSTSGVLVAARNRSAYDSLRELFSTGHVRKSYLALVAGGPLTEPGEVMAEIEAVPGDKRRVRLCPADTAQRVPQTHYRPLLRLGSLTLVEAVCSSGRRHQVRAHLASAGHPLVGDDLYGGPPDHSCEGAFLHARAVSWKSENFSARLPAGARRDLLLSLAHAHGIPLARLSPLLDRVHLELIR